MILVYSPTIARFVKSTVIAKNPLSQCSVKKNINTVIITASVHNRKGSECHCSTDLHFTYTEHQPIVFTPQTVCYVEVVKSMYYSFCLSHKGI